MPQILSTEKKALIAHNMAKHLLAHYDSRDASAILSLATSTLLINADNAEMFEEYRTAFKECLDNLQWVSRSHVKSKTM